MNVRLAYGQTGLDVELPASATTVVEPTHARGRAPTSAPRCARRSTRRSPARRCASSRAPARRVAISMCDGTRAQPRDLMIPAVLDELAGIVADADVVILVATGTHRGNTDEELRAMLGDEVFERVEVVNHDARDADSLVYARRARQRRAGLRSTGGGSRPTCASRPGSSSRTSSPASAAGRSSSRPGSPGLDTVLVLHDAARIGDPRATWGVIDGNPVHDDIRAAAAAAPPHFSFDVILNREQRIIDGVRGRDWPDARRRLRRGAALRDAAGRRSPSTSS